MVDLQCPILNAHLGRERPILQAYVVRSVALSLI